MSMLREHHPRFVSRVRALWALPALLVATGAALALPSGALAAGVQVKVSAPSHTLVAGKNLYLRVSATQNCRAVSGKARYEFLYQGSVVNKAPWQSLRAGKTTFGIEATKAQAQEAVGQQFVLRVIVTTAHGQATANWPVTFKV